MFEKKKIPSKVRQEQTYRFHLGRVASWAVWSSLSWGPRKRTRPPRERPARLKVCSLSPLRPRDFEYKWKSRFAYMQLSPPAKGFRKAELRSQNSSWPCLKRLTSPQVSGVLRFAPWEAPVSPGSHKYPQDVTLCCSITLKGAFKSCPEAGSQERFLSYLAYAEPLVDKTGTKQFQGGECRGWKETCLVW